MTDIKLKVERCGECPWRRMTMERGYCGRHERLLRILDSQSAPPHWCPIRGKVVTIEGPGVVTNPMQTRSKCRGFVSSKG